MATALGSLINISDRIIQNSYFKIHNFTNVIPVVLEQSLYLVEYSISVVISVP
ncbi:MAG: hypothetical protein AAGI69_16850 [Cyanobacteria bacterium P01_H01_bin.21]